MNRALRLEEASLRDPERIDTLARQAWSAIAASRAGDPHGFATAGCESLRYWLVTPQ